MKMVAQWKHNTACGATLATAHILGPYFFVTF